jgi:L-aminopeptidase/D-esterase-like protein
MRGGLGLALVLDEALHVGAVAVVNAVGDVLDEHGRVLAGARNREGGWAAGEQGIRRLRLTRSNPLQITNTTLVVVATNARLSKVDANRVAQRGHDGMARAIRPSHTMFDGDIVFALGGGDVEVPVDVVAEAGAEAVARAIREGVRAASSHPTAPSASSL